MSTPGGYFKTLTLARVQEIREKDLEKAKSYTDRIGEAFTVRSYKVSRVHLFF